MSEQSEQDTPKAEASAAAPDGGRIESPPIAPDHEAPKIKATGSEIPRIEASKASAPGAAGKMLIMSPGDRAWRGETGAIVDQIARIDRGNRTCTGGGANIAQSPDREGPIGIANDRRRDLLRLGRVGTAA